MSAAGHDIAIALMNAQKFKLAELLPSNFSELLQSKGATFIERAGTDNVRRVVVDVLCGQNIRASTEHLTRLRLGKINAATFLIYLRGLAVAHDFSRQVPALAWTGLSERSSKAEKELSKWLIGLTGKGFQNVLRDDSAQLKKYVEAFAVNLERLAKETGQELGDLNCSVSFGNGKQAKLDWHDLLSLFCTIGAQTLAIRGSDKSTYGKLFERLVLGSVLTALGFEQTGVPPSKTSNVFWLSSRFGEREADATLLVSPGQAIRFDLGFIGRGNPEITKDKVSRYERELEIGSQKYHSATCIIVDRIGEDSGLADHAGRIGAKVIQMSLSYWPLTLATWLSKQFDYKSDILNCPPAELPALFKQKLAATSFANFVNGLVFTVDED